MSVQSAQTGTSSAPDLPQPGQVVGGRFRVQDVTSEDAIGVVLSAVDDKTNKPIALRVLRSGLLSNPDAVKRLKGECRTAAQLGHRNVIATYGVGNVGGRSQFVACEWVDGVTLSALVRKRRDEGTRLSLRGAYNVVAHVCNALTHAADKTSHGALRPSVVWVTSSGRVKVGDFGIGRAVVTEAGAAALGEAEQACLAPEVKTGAAPDGRSDIFGVGAILYEMLTGMSPAEGFVPPSQTHPDANEAIDQVLLKCLAGDPAARYPDANAVREALLPLVADAPEVPPEQDFGIDIDVEINLASSRPPPTAGAPPVPVPRAPGLPEAPKVGARVSLHEEFRPSLASSPVAMSPVSMSPADAGPEGPRVSEVDLKGLLAKITENDAPRWMVVKDKLDHGPFSGRELVEMILAGDVLEDHGLLNMDTGERRNVRGFPEFVEFLEQYKIKQQQAAHEAALNRSAKVEKLSNVAKALIAAGVLGVLLLAGGIFLLTRESADDEVAADQELADLYERGDIQIEGTAGILEAPTPRRGGRGGGGMGPARAGGGSLSYEEAMNQAVNLGDVSMGGGGERQLTSGDVAGVMNRHINQLFSCVSAELRRGGNISNVQIDLAIAGSGQVIGASARQGSPQFKSCIAGRVRSIRFPSFPAPRMGARYSFRVD